MGVWVSCVSHIGVSQDDCQDGQERSRDRVELIDQRTAGR